MLGLQGQLSAWRRGARGTPRSPCPVAAAADAYAQAAGLLGPKATVERGSTAYNVRVSAHLPAGSRRGPHCTCCPHLLGCGRPMPSTEVLTKLPHMRFPCHAAPAVPATGLSKQGVVAGLEANTLLRCPPLLPQVTLATGLSKEEVAAALKGDPHAGGNHLSKLLKFVVARTGVVVITVSAFRQNGVLKGAQRWETSFSSCSRLWWHGQVGPLPVIGTFFIGKS